MKNLENQNNQRRGRGNGRGLGNGNGNGRGNGFGNGQHLGGGGGRNHGGGFGTGGFCVCAKCGEKTPHQTGVKCTTIKCSSCGHVMVREELLAEKKK